MIFPLLPVFLVETLGASPTYLGFIEGAADTLASILKLASGVAADAIPQRKPLVVLGYGIASAARPFVALATQPWHVLAVRLSDRLGKGIRSSPRDAMIADAAGDRAGRAFGFHQAMDNVGAVFGPLLATALLLRIPIRSVFWVAAIPGALATALAASVREPERSRTALEPVDPGSPRLERPLLFYLAIVLTFSLGNSSDAFLLLRARSVGLTTVELPILWSVLNLSKVAWALLGGSLGDRWPRARIVAAGWGVFALVYAGLARATAPWQVWALFVLYGVFYGLTEPVEKALVKDLAPAGRRGKAYGAYNFVVGISTLPASLLAGLLWRTVGPGAALGTAAAIALLAAFLLLTWQRFWQAPRVE